MLRHQETIARDTSPSPVTGAAETRVTAEELADALAAIEARKSERARGMEGTLPIGEAIAQLDLDATPDEILAEVEAQRTHQAQIAAQRGAKVHRGWLVPFALLPALLLVGLFSVRSTPVMAPAMVAQVASPMPIAGQDIQVIDETGGGRIVRTLSEIGNGQPIRCGFYDAVRLFSNGAGATASPGLEGDQAKRWRLIKFGGKFYLRGWLALPMSETALRSGPVTLYSAPPTPEGAARITLPIETSQYRSGSIGSEPEQIQLTVPFVDGHVWERW